MVVRSVSFPVTRCSAVLVLCACLALAGCGFHLQGHSPLPSGVKSIYVSYHSNYTVGDPPVVVALRQRLRRQHLLGGPDAPAQLRIVSVHNSQDNVSRSSLNRNVVERSLTSKVVFDYSVDGQRRLSNNSLSETRYFSVAETQRLAQSNQRQTLTEKMQRAIADRILARIARNSDEPVAKPDQDE